MIKGNCRASVIAMLKEVKIIHRKIDKEVKEISKNQPLTDCYASIQSYEDLVYLIESRLEDLN